MNQIICQAIATLAGIVFGTLLAFWLERRRERVRRRKRRELLLDSLRLELRDNYRVLRDVQPEYEKTDWGRSFYIGTTVWDSALAAGDLVEVLGSEVTDLLGSQYALFQKIRYYVELLTRVWLAPDGVQGYTEMRDGFHHSVHSTLCRALNNHRLVLRRVEEELY